MSLVNDMLRDLDQRRNKPDGSGAPVSLTPVPEMYKDESSQPVWLYLGIALLIAGGAIAYFWLQQGDSDAARPLNIRTPVVVQPPGQAGEDEATVQVATEEVAVAAVELAEQTDSSSASALNEPVIAQDAEIASSALVAELSSAGNEIETEVPGQAVIEKLIPQTTDSSQLATVMIEEPASSAMSSAKDSDNAGSTETIPEAEQGIPAESEGAAIVNLAEVPVESVKNAARLSAEERDTIAVQDALGLIADNNTVGAYARLEKELLDNRYAHQSRETYAKLLMSQGEAYSALELADSGLALAPNHAGYKKVKARILMSAGEIEAATELLMRRAPPISEDIEYHEILATAQLSIRDYEGALISYTSLVQQDRSRGKWWYGFAASQDFLGNSAAAKQGYSRAMQLSNLSPNLRRRSQERLALLGQ